MSHKIHKDNKEGNRVRSERWRQSHPKESRAKIREAYAKSKAAVFAYYGNKCNWEGCTVTDPDMLSIDHVDNNGANHRRQIGGRGIIYTWLINNNFPEGFQLLCMNHQWKKERMHRRALAESFA